MKSLSGWFYLAVFLTLKNPQKRTRLSTTHRTCSAQLRSDAIDIEMIFTSHVIGIGSCFDGLIFIDISIIIVSLIFHSAQNCGVRFFFSSLHYLQKSKQAFRIAMLN